MAGFKLAHTMEEFNKNFKMRFIIVDLPFYGSEEDITGKKILKKNAYLLL